MRATKNSKEYDLRNSGNSGSSATVSGVQNAAAAGAAGSTLMTIPIQVGNTMHSKNLFSKSLRSANRLTCLVYKMKNESRYHIITYINDTYYWCVNHWTVHQLEQQPLLPNPWLTFKQNTVACSMPRMLPWYGRKRFNFITEVSGNFTAFIIDLYAHNFSPNLASCSWNQCMG